MVPRIRSLLVLETARQRGRPASVRRALQNRRSPRSPCEMITAPERRSAHGGVTTDRRMAGGALKRPFPELEPRRYRARRRADTACLTGGSPQSGRAGSSPYGFWTRRSGPRDVQTGSVVMPFRSPRAGSGCSPPYASTVHAPAMRDNAVLLCVREALAYTRQTGRHVRALGNVRRYHTTRGDQVPG